MKGRYHYRRLTVEDLRQSVDYLWEAIELDPSYGEAYAALAQTYSLMPNMFVVPPEEGYAEAKRLADKALSLDETLEDAHIAMGWSLACYDHDWQGSEAAFRRAVEFAPNSAPAHARFGWILSWTGRHDEALEEQRLASKLDPLSAIAGQHFAASAFVARRYDQAIAQAKKTLALHPDHFFLYVRLGMAYALEGMYPEALEAFQRADGLTEDPIRPADVIAWVHALMGDRERARQMLRRILQAEESSRAPFALSVVYAALGEHDRALESLEKAYAVRDPNLVLLKVWPPLTPSATTLASRTSSAA